LLHRPLMGGLLHLVQRRGVWVGCGPPSLLHAVPNVTAYPSTASVPTSTSFICCMQVGAWSESPYPPVWRHHMRHTVVQNSSERRRLMSPDRGFGTSCQLHVVIWQSRPVQKTVEDVFVCQGLRRLVTLILGAGYKYSDILTYLLHIIRCGIIIAFAF